MKSLNKNIKGFTIIEVMIVLAIAGLIMVVVLIAAPQLQRTQRNGGRKDVVNRIKTELDNYSSNNNGQIPTDSTTLSAFTTRYLTNINIKDPKTGSDMTPNLAAASATLPSIGTLNYSINANCSGEFAQSNGANARSYALWTQLEGGAGYCVSNQ